RARAAAGLAVEHHVEADVAAANHAVRALAEVLVQDLDDRGHRRLARGIRVALQIIRVGDRGPTDLGGTIEVVERGPELLESLFHDLRRDRLTGSRNDLRAWIHALRYGLQQSAQHRWHDGDRIRAVGLDELHRIFWAELALHHHRRAERERQLDIGKTPGVEHRGCQVERAARLERDPAHDRGCRQVARRLRAAGAAR